MATPLSMPPAAGAKGTGGNPTDDQQQKERQLYRQGADATAKGETKLLASILRKHPGLVKETDDCGRTLLHVAASQGQSDSAAVLLSEGACLAARELESKWTPLHCALYKHHLRAAAVLIQSAGVGGVALLNGAGSEDKEGFTPLDLLSLVHRPAAKPQRGGDTHACGSGVNYQLGSGANMDVKIPRRLAALRGFSVTQVATSSRHTLFLTDSGEVFATGYGPGGRMGTGNEHTQMSPVPVAKLRHVSYVAAGPNGSAAISGDGNLYCWGLSALGIARAKVSVRESHALMFLWSVDLTGVVTCSPATGPPGKASCSAQTHAGRKHARPSGETDLPGRETRHSPY